MFKLFHARSLASRINIEAPKQIVDVGCGPGNSTKVLHKRWPNAKISGFDSSYEMLEKAKASKLKVEWFHSTVEDWSPIITFDVIFSNAVLQWAQPHNELIPKLLNQLNEGGALAVQMPALYKSPVHRQIIEVAKMPEWKEFTTEACDLLTLSPPSFYYDLLAPITSHLDIWETKYFHVMESTQVILEWFRGTGLRPFLKALPSQESQAAFEQELMKRYIDSYPAQKNGNVIFPFKRFFFVGYK